MKITGTSAEIVTAEDRIRPPGSEVEVLLSDPANAAARLGWAATVALEDGLRRTAEWLAPRVDAMRAGRYHL